MKVDTLKKRLSYYFNECNELTDTYQLVLGYILAFSVKVDTLKKRLSYYFNECNELTDTYQLVLGYIFGVFREG